MTRSHFVSVLISPVNDEVRESLRVRAWYRCHFGLVVIKTTLGVGMALTANFILTPKCTKLSFVPRGPLAVLGHQVS